jgi:hypothetical protein
MLVAAFVAAAYTLFRIVTYYAAPASTHRYHVEAAWFGCAAIGLMAIWLSRPAGLDATPATALTNTQRLAFVAGLGALVFLVYWPTLHVGLLSDDFPLIERADRGAIFSNRGEFIRPAPIAIWAIVRRVSSSPVALHALNLAIHTLNGALLALVAIRIGLAPMLAGVAATLFVLFPAHLEAVAWVSGLQELAMTAGVLTFLVFVVSDRPSVAGTPAGALALGVALLSKETAVIAPVVALTLIPLVAPDRRAHAGKLIAAGFVLAAGYAMWRLTAIATPSGYQQAPSRYFGKELVSHLFGTLAVPWSVAELTRLPWLGLLSALAGFGVGVIGLSCGARDATHRRRLTLLGIWIVVAVLPVYQFFFVSPTLQGSRYLYLSACAWMLLVASTVSALASLPSRWPSQAAWIAVAAAAAVFAVGVRWHAQPWNAAAGLRDRVLAETRRVQTDHHCDAREIDVRDLPDSVEGAYVFRNGFPEALAMMPAGAVQPFILEPPDARARCQFRWTEAGLVADAKGAR